MKDLFNLKDKVAIVTGGYGHLGYEMSLTLQSYGAKVYIAGLDFEKFKKRTANNTGFEFIKIDISSAESIINTFAEIHDKESKIDILINNAFYGAANHPEKITNNEWEKGLDGALNSVFRTIREIIPFMKEKGGKIINISSMYGVVVPDLNVYRGREEFLNPPNYGVGKAGVIHLTKYYAMYLAKYGINVNSISPGPFPSEEVQKDATFVDRLVEKVPAKRIGKPADLSGAITLLASGASDYITGQNLCIDGGWTL